MTVNLTNLNRVTYSGNDFPTALQEVLSNLQVQFASSYNDFTVSSLGIVILDIFAFSVDSLSFYLDRRATDLFLSTARTNASVARTARQLGYKMSPATASSVDIEISPTQSQTFIIPFPVGYQITSPDGSIWESASAYNWPASNTATQTITFSQTRTLTTTFTSDGTANQVFNIANIPTGEFLVGPGSDNVSQITVNINNLDWTEEQLLVFGQTNEFEVGYNDSPPTLRFGDNIAGNIPPANTQIQVTFKTSRGTVGQVTSGQPMSVVKPLSVNFTSINFNLSVPTGSSGGSNPESISQAQAIAPTYFKSRGVNVTTEDYNIRASSYVDSVFGAVAEASAISVFNASTDAYLQSLVTSIILVSSTYISTVSTSVTAIEAILAQITSALTNATANSAAISTDISSISTQATTLSTASSGAAVASGLTGSYVSQMNDNITSLINSINGIAVGGADSLSTATYNSINAVISTLQGLINSTTLQVSLISSSINTISSSISSIQTTLSDLTTQQSELQVNINTANTDVASAVTSLNTLVVSVNNIENDVSVLGNDIIQHVDSFLASDCQSNLIEVPILTLDSDGFYTAPTIALLQSLQTFLDDNKELTQVVRVFSGASQIVAAVLNVNVNVLKGYVQATITSQVEAALLQVLKGRVFGDSLYLSELHAAVAVGTENAIAGVFSINIQITGPIANLDGFGNLIIQSNQVVSYGAITITSQLVTGS